MAISSLFLLNLTANMPAYIGQLIAITSIQKHGMLNNYVE